MTDQNAALSAEAKKNLWGNAALHMLWSCIADPRFSYRVFIPDEYLEEDRPELGLLVFIHATGCGVEYFLNAAAGWAADHHLALMAPVFPSGILDHGDFNAYKDMAGGGLRYDLILTAMLEEMGKRYPGVQTGKFFLFGHSGGGMFANRFLLVHPERVRAAVISAPGRPTMISEEEDYGWGIRNFREIFDKPFDLAAVRQVPVHVLVGEKDNRFIGENRYGDNRLDRMKNFAANLRAAGVAADLEIIPGIGHIDGSRERIAAAERYFEQFL
jgi:pimeloyl-ACP methyl ester carboxylesterase